MNARQNPYTLPNLIIISLPKPKPEWQPPFALLFRFYKIHAKRMLYCEKRKEQTAMQRVIYGDVFFLVNFSMDYLGIYLVRKLTHKPPRLFRELAAASLGGLYALIALFIPPTAETIFTFVMPFLMVRIAFSHPNKKELFKDGVTMFGISFALGGIMTAAYYGIGKFLSSHGILLNGSPETVYSDLPLPIIALTAAFAALFAYLWGRLTKQSVSKKELEITVKAEGKTVTIKALCDSGNLLEDPLTRLPVIIVTKKAMEQILPHSLKKIFFNSVLTADQISPRMMKKTRFIPTSTVTGDSLLCGFIPDSVTVEGVEKNACLALDKTANDFNGTDAILPTVLLG